MRINKLICLALLCALCVGETWAQRGKRAMNRIDREVQETVFIPKGTWMAGGTVSYSEHDEGNLNFLVLKNVEGKGSEMCIRDSLWIRYGQEFHRYGCHLRRLLPNGAEPADRYRSRDDGFYHRLVGRRGIGWRDGFRFQVDRPKDEPDRGGASACLLRQFQDQPLLDQHRHDLLSLMEKI